MNTEFLNSYWMPCTTASGINQMALDEALLTWVQSFSTPVLVARTYQWLPETLSLGCHQQLDSTQRAYHQYAKGKAIPIVRRPTGGRAILHGDDVSFTFVTNAPDVLAMSLDESYCLFTCWVREALSQCGISLMDKPDANKKAYVTAPLCFASKTPSDLSTMQGEKVCGSAQLRRKGGILQHGAAFIGPFEIAPRQFEFTLQQVIQNALNAPLNILNLTEVPILQAAWEQLKQAYTAESAMIATKLLTTSGSHLLPASD